MYDTNDAAVQALKNGQIDGIVVDLPTAFYVTAVQVPDGVIVGSALVRKLEAAGSPEGRAKALADIQATVKELTAALD